MQEVWDKIWEDAQSWKTDGWNGIIEDWYNNKREQLSSNTTRTFDKLICPEDTAAFWYAEQLDWYKERDRTREIICEWEEEMWVTTTHTSITGTEQTRRIRKP